MEGLALCGGLPVLYKWDEVLAWALPAPLRGAHVRTQQSPFPLPHLLCCVRMQHKGLHQTPNASPLILDLAVSRTIKNLISVARQSPTLTYVVVEAQMDLGKSELMWHLYNYCAE